MSELPYDLSTKDRNDPHSLINMMPTFFAERYEAVPLNVLEMSDEALKKHIKNDLDLERLRVSFWNEYDRAIRTKTTMLISNILGGVCSKEYFNKHVITNSYKIAYIARPMLDLATSAEEMLHFANEQVRSILAIPHIDAKGKINTNLAKLKLEVFKEVYNRVKGMVVQRVDQRNVNVNVNQTQALPKSLDEVNARLAELEKPIAIDVTPTPVVTHEE